MKKLTDDDGRLRFGKYKGTKLSEVPAYSLGETCAWAEAIAKEAQEELDRRVAELRASEVES